MSNEKILIQLNSVSFNYEGEDPLFEDVQLTVKEGEVTSLVGANGSGKSTLLKLLVGKLKPIEGTAVINCKPYYVQQVDLTVAQEEKTIYEYISEFYENWWEIPNETEKLFGLTINTEAQAKTLSGGELMKLNLAIALAHKPDVLVLDEPTNHLDVSSISNLIEFINSNKDQYSYLIVSHDTFFLNSVVNRTIELENGELTVYGGNYDFYKEQKELHLRGLKKQYDIAKHKLLNAEAQAQKEKEKQEQRAAKTKKEIAEGSERDKKLIGKMQDSGSSTNKAAKTAFERIKAEAEDALEVNELDEERRLAFMNITNTKDNKGKTIFETKEAKLYIGETALIEKLNLKVEYGDRVVIAGNNGSGKTSLIKGLIKLGDPNSKDTDLGEAHIEGEVIVHKELNWVYIDQNYSLIKPELSLLENLIAYNPNYTQDKAKEQLGKFQFKTVAEMNKPGKNLSGGEMVRLIMAMITAFPIDMIILDEPTNNLDVETVEVLVKSLNNFRGAIMVISHNIDFLNNINIKTSYIIKDGKLTLMNIDPKHKEAYYKALSKA